MVVIVLGVMQVVLPVGVYVTGGEKFCVVLSEAVDSVNFDSGDSGSSEVVMCCWGL